MIELAIQTNQITHPSDLFAIKRENYTMTAARKNRTKAKIVAKACLEARAR